MSSFAVNNVSVDLLQALHKKPTQIRNICIVAHVDHGVYFVVCSLRHLIFFTRSIPFYAGKTTLADSLIATNGIISQHSAGQVRYLDFNKEEVARQITMKVLSVWSFIISLLIIF